MKKILLTICSIASLLTAMAQFSSNTGPSTSTASYILTTLTGAKYTSILTAGDEIGGYKLAGIPDGTGAFDNYDGTFTLLVNHEFGNTVGIARAHGSKGAFVSKWVIRKSDLTVLSGSDLIQKVKIWNGTGYDSYTSANPSSLTGFGRFCSADLPEVSAFYNINTGKGTKERIFMNGEESGDEGRAFGHIATGANAGTSYELPYLGKFSWENSIASPIASDKTVVAGTDDSTPGQVYFYVGTKTNTGDEIVKAGLTGGKLYGVSVSGLAAEVSGSFPAAGTAFGLVDLGYVASMTGTALNTASNTAGVTTFLRPEDGAWDPTSPNDFYFATTNSFSSPSRLWRLRFIDATVPELGGTITAVLDGTEGQRMLDNLTIDKFGHILLQEDPGGNEYLAKQWQYTIANDALLEIGVHNPTFFSTVGGASFITNNEETSGIIDAQDILGKGYFLLVDQVHASTTVPGIVEGGQILAYFNPDTYNAVPTTFATSSKPSYILTSVPGAKYKAILTAGDEIGGYKLAGTPDGTGAFDNNDGTFTLLVNHEFNTNVGIVRAHGSKGAFVSKWVIRKSDLAVLSGSDLITTVKIWNGAGYDTYNSSNPSSLTGFGRFCSADLPAVSAFYNTITGNGTMERIFMNGEENGDEGRAFGHIASGSNAGTSYELPYLGKFSWENSIASPIASDKTVVAGTDDSTPGQVYFYVGTKKNTGTEVEKAGLTGGKLYGVSVSGLAAEVSGSFPAAGTAFGLVDLGYVASMTGVSLNTASNTAGVTTFLRPEDGAWDPTSPNDFYFATTNSFSSPSRLWRLRFIDAKNPELGGTITAVLDGTEGQRMLDNLTIDKFGHVLLQEDPGGNEHLAKEWQYTIATDEFKLIGTHNPTYFSTVGGASFITNNEETSGIIDAQDILGKGYFLLVDQVHAATTVPGLVEGGQILALFNPDTYNAITSLEDGIVEVENTSTFVIYPNPVTGYVVNFSEEISGNIFNSTGVEVVSFSKTSKLNVEGLPKGIYLLRANEGVSGKFIIE